MTNYLKNVDYQFLIRVLNNEVSPEEKEYFEEWLSESDKNREDFGVITLLWDKIGSSECPPSPDPELQWKKITTAVHNSQKKDLNPDHRIETEQSIKKEAVIYQFDGDRNGFFKNIFSSGMFQAAAILLIAVTAGWWVLNNRLQHQTNISLTQHTPVNLIEVITRKAEKVSLTLSDGSKVHLNTFSRLTYPEFFDDSGRNVELEGEAYFSVTPDKKRPFIVKSGGTLTVVRGTEFNIKNRGESISVVVVKGVVDTYNSNLDEVYKLKKGDYISYTEQKGFSSPQKADLQRTLAWRKDKFSFKRTPLKEVMEELERFYNVNVTFSADSLKSKTITGTFNSNSINNILSIISLTLDLKINYSKGNIIVDKN
jgi:ferric-dicitrate binding protein FerR (iron transport regulator)